MKSFTKLFAAWTLIFVLLFNAVGCLPILPEGEDNSPVDPEFYIDGDSTITLEIGQSLKLNLIKAEELTGDVIWTSSSSCVSVQDGLITALSEGTAIIKATIGDKADRVVVNVPSAGDENNSGNENTGDGESNGNESTGDGENDENGNGGSDVEEEYVFGSNYPCITIAKALEIAESYTNNPSNQEYYMVATVDEISYLAIGEMMISDETGSIYVYESTNANGGSLSGSGLEVGNTILICGTLRNFRGTLEIQEGRIIAFYNPETEEPPLLDGIEGGNGSGGSDGNDGDGGSSGGNGSNVTVPGVDDPIQSDPYVNVNKTEFYKNYTPAISYMDAYYRTQHGLMSGSIAAQDQAPTISSNRPMSNGMYIRNNVYLFSEDGNTYYVVDYRGEIVMEIYKGGAYVVLEEVAAYVFAFGTVPANQSSSKKTKPTSSVWGEYLRLNDTKFSGSTSSYPYEPVLPDITGCGGSTVYHEMDIGTTGTDCDPTYTAALYNNGTTITRGAARIVYTYSDKNGNKIIDLDERYVFYTYNHYNDFQEYLNYLGGWGQMFGNITGGGTISSKYDYNPTPYVAVVHGSLSVTNTRLAVYFFIPKDSILSA